MWKCSHKTLFHRGRYPSFTHRGTLGLAEEPWQIHCGLNVECLPGLDPQCGAIKRCSL
jgi:hypothetical protein